MASRAMNYSRILGGRALFIIENSDANAMLELPWLELYEIPDYSRFSERCKYFF